MAINLSDNILAKTTAPADAKYGPYVSSSLTGATAAACAYLNPSYRYEGLTVGLIVGTDDIIEYWFLGGVSDDNLVPKKPVIVLNDIADINTYTGLTDGQILVYSGGTWYNKDNTPDFPYSGNTDYQILIWSGNTWHVSDKLIQPGTFEFNPSTGIMKYETPEDGHYEMAIFGSSTGLIGVVSGQTLTYNGDYWINVDTYYTTNFTGNTTIVYHNLGKKPSVKILNNLGEEIEGEIRHINQNSLEINFNNFDSYGSIICEV